VLTWKYWLLLAPILCCGCAHGFDRAALRERMNTGTLQSPDAAIAEARGMKPQLSFPCRIAVYVKPSGDREWRWTPEDRAAMDQWAATLRQEGIVADIFLLPDMLTGRGDVKELRLAAAQCGADALFVIHGAAQTDSYKNFASVFNITLVGGYFVPSSHKDSLFMMEGILLDVDNGYVYTGVQAEGIGRIVRPTFTVEERDAIAMAKASAVPQFGTEVVKRMRTLSTASAAKRVISEASDLKQAGGVVSNTKTDAHRPDAGTLGNLMPRITTPNAVVHPTTPDQKGQRYPGLAPTIEVAPGYGLGTVRDAVRGLVSIQSPKPNGVFGNISTPKPAP
jgi:rhombotail lipoprotein